MSGYYETYWGHEGCAEASWEQVWGAMDREADGIDGLHGQVVAARGGQYAQRALGAACKAILSGGVALAHEARSLHRFVVSGDLAVATWEARLTACGLALGMGAGEIKAALERAQEVR